MTPAVKRSTLLAAALLCAAFTATASSNAEQVVFSTPGFLMSLDGNSKAGTTPFGFWIWCAGEAAPRSRGGYQNANACQGSMYFYALDTHATSVIGFVTETAPGIETMLIQQGTFPQLRAAGFGPIPGSPYSCMLANDTPNPVGTGNGVTVKCWFSSALGGGSGTADVTNAVVNITGP